MYAIGEQLTILAGPLLGGLVASLWGPVQALAVNAATFFFAGTTVLAAPRPRHT